MGGNPTENPTNSDPKASASAPCTLSFKNTAKQTSATASARAGCGGRSGACAVCKYQRRKCPPDCPLAPYFPAYKKRDFLNVHKLFGVKNLTRALDNIDKRNRHDFMVSMIYEANARAADPVGGCRSVIQNLNNQLYYSAVELDIVNQQLAFYRFKHQELQMAAAAAYDPPPHPVQGFEVSSSDQGLSDTQDLISHEKRHLVGNQGFPYTFSEKQSEPEPEIPFECAGSAKLSDGTVVIDDLIKVGEEEDDLKNAASKFSLRK